jgi:hypothetical protein
VGHVGKRGVESEILFRELPGGEQQAKSICAQISRKFDGSEYKNMIADKAI